MNEIPKEAQQEGFAALGSLIALIFMSDTAWPRKILYFLGGWGLSKLFGESVQGVIGTSLETARAITALFGLAVVEKAFDVIHSFDAKRLGRSLLARIEKRIKG